MGAILKDNEEFVKLLIGKGAAVNLCSGQGFTPIYQASMGNQANLVELLLAAGADVNIPDEEDLTPIHVAARDGAGECALLLVKAGADLRARNTEGRTAEEMAQFLASCASGVIPPNPPTKRVREAPVMREIV